MVYKDIFHAKMKREKKEWRKVNLPNNPKSFFEPQFEANGYPVIYLLGLERGLKGRGKLKLSVCLDLDERS